MMYNENEPVKYQAQHHYHSKQTIKPPTEEPQALLNIVGIAAVTTLLLTIVGIVISFK